MKKYSKEAILFKEFVNSITKISDKEFDDSMVVFNRKFLKKGEFFIEQGEICRNIAYVISGILKVYYINHKAEEITSCFCTQNSLTTSFRSFNNQEPSPLSIKAVGDTELLVIDYNSLQDLYRKSNVWQWVGRSLAEREYITMEKYASVLNNETAKEKYLRLLKEQPHVVHLANIKDIASYLGVTRRTLSRIRQEIARNI